MSSARPQAQALDKFVRGQFSDSINVGPPPTPPPPGLSSPWLQTDIGSPPAAGNASDAQNVLTLTGSGLTSTRTRARITSSIRPKPATGGLIST
jgi:hypothetical protein